ncbi:T5orf172 domain-containing protein [Soonwooa buanensis]|uniref:T5orf172 domain-containing protein n=1 Tax=Soonwooa buanensis TaxID=619805 RepID=A0A1T5GVF0_9FLAO|nr:T5orf172 domain-containing protein [Soonwooa buanensis]
MVILELLVLRKPALRQYFFRYLQAKMKPAPKKIQDKFEEHLFQFRKEEILELAKSNGNIFSVINGIHKEVYGIYIIDESESNFLFHMFYISKINNELIGYLLELRPLQEFRNQIVSIFSSYLVNIFKKDNQLDFESVFNTFQYSQVTVFEQYGFDVVLLDEEMMKRRGDMMIKYNGKGVVFIPVISTSPENVDNHNFIPINTTKIRNLKEGEHFVYLMYNQLNKYYKIGKTKNKSTLTFREKTLQAEDPNVLTFEVWIVKENYEKKLHKQFENKRLRGEWFNLDYSDLKILKKTMEKFACR